MTSNTLRVAVVGAGLIARKKHLPAWQDAGGQVSVTAICDSDIERAEKLANQLESVSIFSDFGKLLSQHHPDIIDICTPPATHAEFCLKALDASCHVLVEKPMALDGDECEEIVSAVERSDSRLAVAHSDLYYSSFLRAREVIQSGAVGAFRGMRLLLATPKNYITEDENHWAHELPGGVIGETGPHAVYMSLPFIGDVDHVTASGRKMLDEYPWSVYEDYRIQLHGTEGTSSIALTYATDQWAAEVEWWGESGILRADLQDQSVVCYRRPDLSLMSVGKSALKTPLERLLSGCQKIMRVLLGMDRSTHSRLVRRFADHIIKDRPITVNARHGRQTVLVMERITQSLE